MLQDDHVLPNSVVYEEKEANESQVFFFFFFFFFSPDILFQSVRCNSPVGYNSDVLLLPVMLDMHIRTCARAHIPIFPISHFLIAENALREGHPRKLPHFCSTSIITLLCGEMGYTSNSVEPCKVGEKGNKESPSNRHNFIYLERGQESDQTYLNLILNFKKQKLTSEEQFDGYVELHKNSILHDIQRVQMSLEEYRGKWKDIIEERIRTDDNIYKETMDSESRETVHNCKDTKGEIPIFWELDLSHNRFKDISIDKMIAILTCHKIVGEEMILRVQNLRTLNLSKNNLCAFPYMQEVKFSNLMILSLSNNSLGTSDVARDYSRNTLKEGTFEDLPNEDNVDMHYATLVAGGTLNDAAPNLIRLYLQNNKIKSLFFVNRLVNHHGKLTHINISFNVIEELDFLPFLQNLEQLDLSFNTQLSHCYDERGDNKKVPKKGNEHTENCFTERNSSPCVGDNRDPLFYNLLANLKSAFPNLKKVNIKHTPIYDLIKRNIGERKNKNELSYWPF
ncbi:leucine-rich repeat protein [Plasmodium ovale wallikeri]|uniref:Leucine-rich repeat protein n=1 Tax=Plasmodium ovale wallikeri TaxID=864142 RepID=A0A1A8Z3A4_PLAOA|nr:leucine-rich repeat protein [Plasmodium ovale wallikeri]SBT38249.1 leucine-rich repeat protein [Plasmodium ovale wallikeri]